MPPALFESCQSFTYCFNRKGFQDLGGRRALTRLWGSRFAVVRPGDYLYVVSYQSGKLHLCCRVKTDTINLPSQTMDVVRATPIDMDRTVTDAGLRRLRFQSGGRTVGLSWTQKQLVDPQSIRGLRRLTERSAAYLDELLGLAREDGPMHTEMRALSVRQPWAELILRGQKTIELRGSATRVRERVMLYASPVRYDPAQEESLARRLGLDLDGLDRGVLVGSVEIAGSRPAAARDGKAACVDVPPTMTAHAWLLKNPIRAARLIRPVKRPQPIWFYPF